MSITPRLSSSEQNTIASQLGLIGVCLLLFYVGSVLVAVLPPQILNPTWQLQFVNTLVNTSSIGLVGLALVHLAAFVDPNSVRLGRRRDAFAGWAFAAAIGFFLLIPLQGYAAWHGWTNANLARSQQLKSTERKTRELRQAITSATTTQQLQSNLRALQAPSLPADALDIPLPRLRQQLLEDLERSAGPAKERYQRIPPESVWALVQNTLRNILSALVFAVGTAALARRRGVELTLWQEIQSAWRRRQKRTGEQTRRKGFGGKGPKSEREYLLGISATEEDSTGNK